LELSKDGGPAFPFVETENPYESVSTGMTMRDYFAGLFLVAIPHIGCGADLDLADLASDCYKMADAMLAERSESN